MKSTLKLKLQKALLRDPDLLTEKGKESETFGHNPDYLDEILGITKSDLIRLERAGMALKCRYETKDGVHRTRWIIYKEKTDEVTS
jgi:hypothetical protein